MDVLRQGLFKDLVSKETFGFVLHETDDIGNQSSIGKLGLSAHTSPEVNSPHAVDTNDALDKTCTPDFRELGAPVIRSERSFALL